MGYTAAQAARLSGCTTSRLEAWRRIGLVVPDRGVTGSVSERQAGSVPERRAGSVPERQAGSVPERQAGSVSERQAGSVSERQAGSVPERQDGPYSFRDLVVLRMVGALLDEGVPMARIRRAVRTLLDAGDDIAALSLVSEGDTVLACRDDGQVLDALRHGQLALFVSVGRLVEEVGTDVRAFDAERRSFVERLRAEG